MKKIFLLTVPLLIISILLSSCTSSTPPPTAAPVGEEEPTAVASEALPPPATAPDPTEAPTPASPEPTAQAPTPASPEPTPTAAIPDGPIVFEEATFQMLMEKTFNKTEFYPEDFANVTDLWIGADELVILDGNYESYQFFFHPRLNRDFTFVIDGRTFENAVGTIKSLADLKYFTHLERLELIHHINADLETLPTLPQLNTLAVVIGKANNFNFLEQLDGLQRLDLYLEMDPNTAPDMTPIQEIKQLSSLGLMFIPITDLKFLEGKTDLTALAISDAPVEDFSEVASLTNLRFVFIEMTKLKDVSPFMGLENLTSLVLGSNEIDAAGLTQLQELQAAYAQEGKELYIDLLD